MLSRRLVNASTGKPRVSLITGGASGLGAATALAYARAGAAVAISDLPGQSNLANQLLAQIKAEVPEAKLLFLEHDVTNEEQWEQVIAKTQEKLGPLDVLVHAAGIGPLEGPFEDIPTPLFDKIIEINLKGTFLGLKHSIRAMKVNKTKESKSIVTFSSVAGLVGAPPIASYSASKGGVRLMTKSAAVHCATSGYGIRINSVHPGAIETPMVHQIGREIGMNAMIQQQMVAGQPLGRLGQPREIADAVVFLGSEEASFMTGSEVVIDGGMVAQ